MTNEEFEELKDSYIKNIKRYMVETGGLFTHLSIFGDHKEPEDDQPSTAIIHVPVDPRFLKSDETKDVFIDEVVPELAKVINERFIIKGVGWASEAWMRTAEKDQKIDNWKDLPIKKEVLIVTIETETQNQITIYEIKRTGKEVTPEGELIDHIELEEQKDIKSATEGKINEQNGRFTGLYKKFKSHI
jgi:hypothetical protein